MHIPFNKPYFSGNELNYIKKAVESGKISGNGHFTKLCQDFFEKKYNYKKCFLTSSCTDALEMAAILADIRPGDEVIVPSYTFVSTANAFVLRGAKIIFIDSRDEHPGIDEDQIEQLISNKTKAIVPVHYAGVACDMDKIMKIAKKYNLFVIEDAAQAIDSFYINNKGVKLPLGSIGHFATFSFHETKNIISGEGGMLVINDEKYIERAEIIWEKGTNRSKFFRGEIDKYNWVDIGSSFLMSDINAAFLWAQLENLSFIQNERLMIWNYYFNELKSWSDDNKINLPVIPSFATNNAHMFYMCTNMKISRNRILTHLKKENINAVFHYVSLHRSEFYKHIESEIQTLNKTDFYSENLFRLPFYIGLDVDKVVKSIKKINLSEL
jgi:dTDP-4-amino-4,6-dideoxygalactose transaminase